MSIGNMAINEKLCAQRPILDRKSAGDAERIKAVQIAARGQDFRCAEQITTRSRADVAGIQRAQDRGHFAFNLQAINDLLQIGIEACLVFALRNGHIACGHSERHITRQARAMHGIGARDQHVGHLLDAHRAADNMETMRNKRIFKFEHARLQRGDFF